MRPITSIFFLLSVAWVLLASCSQKTTSYDETDELVRFNAYRKVHYPDARKLSDYAFMQVLQSNPGGEKVQVDKWLYFDYWALNLDGVYLGTNVADKARLYGQYSSQMYCVPAYMKVSVDKFGNEVYEALREAHIGDEIVIGLTASKAKALGLWTNADNLSALFFIVPRQVIEDPAQHEETLVADYLNKNPGFEKHDSVYRKVVEVGKGDEVAEQSTVWVQYEIYSLSGYLFDTNIAEVAQRYGIYSSSRSYTLLSFKASEDSKLIRAFSGLTVGLKTGTKLQAVIPSALAYKQAGRNPIRPYEPLFVSMSIVRSSN